MKRIIFSAVLVLLAVVVTAQRPCSSPIYREFDFWLGEWEVFNNANGKKAGQSKISLLLDSCVILEEWTSEAVTQGIRYAGKSFNTYNNTTKQWQQTWVDNVGGSTEFLTGKKENNKMSFMTGSIPLPGDSTAIRRLSFYDLGKDKVRQHGEISKDQGKTWTTEYDLEYRRRR